MKPLELDRRHGLGVEAVGQIARNTLKIEERAHLVDRGAGAVVKNLRLRATLEVLESAVTVSEGKKILNILQH